MPRKKTNFFDKDEKVQPDILTQVLGTLNLFRAPEPLPIPNPSSFVPKNGFPVVKGLSMFSKQE